MRSASPVLRYVSTENGCSISPASAGTCTGIIVCARALWPDKTAEHWAAAAGCGVRTAKYWLSGTYDVSHAGVRAVLFRMLA